ncbi:MAG: hypothetical protein PHI31_02235 [Desulfuromonadaceae bacterium]|nr:hypothetical protein [Desulfuromonadaceae bacterium]
MAGTINENDMYTLLSQVFKPEVANTLLQQLKGDTKPAPVVDRVMPGDLITADLMNRVLLAVADLQKRVAALETSSVTAKKMKITGLLPAGLRRVGDTLHIVGEGLNAPGGTNVMIDSVQVAVSYGISADTELIVKIPNLTVGSGRSVTVFVSNLNGTDTMDFDLLPGVPTLPEGQLFVSLLAGPAGKLMAGSSYVFEYQVRAIVNLAESYTLEASTDAGWKTEIVTAAGQVIAAPKLELPSAPAPDGAIVKVLIRVTIPLLIGISTGTMLRLTVKAVRNPDLAGTSSGEELIIGATAPTPEPVTVGFEEIAATDPANQVLPTVLDGVVKISAGAGKYRVALNAKGCQQSVPYTRVIVPITDARWTASFRRTSSMLSESFTPLEATMETFYVFISAENGAPETELVVRIAADGDASDKGHINQKIAAS